MSQGLRELERQKASSKHKTTFESKRREMEVSANGARLRRMEKGQINVVGRYYLVNETESEPSHGILFGCTQRGVKHGLLQRSSIVRSVIRANWFLLEHNNDKSFDWRRTSESSLLFNTPSGRATTTASASIGTANIRIIER